MVWNRTAEFKFGLKPKLWFQTLVLAVSLVLNLVWNQNSTVTLCFGLILVSNRYLVSNQGFKLWFQRKIKWPNNSLNNFPVITRTTEHEDVEANQHEVSSSLYWERKVSASSWWVCKATEGLCKSLAKQDEHSQFNALIILFHTWVILRNCRLSLRKHFSLRKVR